MVAHVTSRPSCDIRKLEMTGRYVKEIPDQVLAAVEKMDRELCVGTEHEGTRQ